MQKLTHEEISRLRSRSEELEMARRYPVYVLVDNVRSLYNVGSIFRTSDAARIRRLILTGFTPHPPRKEIEKTALGATSSVPWEYVKDPLDAILSLKAQGVLIGALEQTDKGIQHWSLRKEHFPLCLVVGNELTGISERLLAQADIAIEIPMFGSKHSLNVAVAYGIAVYGCIKALHDG